VGTVLDYLFSDHLGSTSITADSSGNLVGGMRYTAFGETRYTAGTTPTNFRYTGQRQAEAGLYYYVARMYDPYLNRFLSPDSIIPDPYNLLDWDRYTYSRNSPIKYIDPTGHWIETALDIAFIAYDLYQINQEGWTLVNTIALAADVACALIPIGTGGGPAVRVAMAGGDTAAAFTRTAVQVPEVIRVGQTAEKFFQFAEGDGSSGINSSEITDSNTALKNSIPGITPPTNYGGLRASMLKADIKAPSNIKMLKCIITCHGHLKIGLQAQVAA
jgi:RHS repeat-associated protein